MPSVVVLRDCGSLVCQLAETSVKATVYQPSCWFFGGAMESGRKRPLRATSRPPSDLTASANAGNGGSSDDEDYEVGWIVRAEGPHFLMSVAGSLTYLVSVKIG